VLTLGQVVGSFAGARLARGLRPAAVRGVVIAVGVVMAISLLVKR